MAEKGSGADFGARAGLDVAGGAARGEKSWTFLYLVAGFAVSIMGTVVQMLEPLHWAAREVLFLALAAVILWQVLANGPMQDRLLGWKAKHEGTPR